MHVSQHAGASPSAMRCAQNVHLRTVPYVPRYFPRAPWSTPYSGAVT